MTVPAAISIPGLLWRLHSLRAIAWLIVLSGVYYIVVTDVEKWRVWRTRNWPVAPGEVQHVGSEYVTAAVSYWKVTFDYVYAVAGESYSGKYHVNCVTEDIRNQALAGLTGNHCRVHYKPGNPANSVLYFDEVWELF